MGLLNGTDLPTRRFTCGWGPRVESALQIAERIQALNLEMAEVEPEWQELWPLLAARAIKRGRDPGPVLELSADDFASIIDRRSRFEPPRYPEPVGPEGYYLVISVNRSGHDPLDVGLYVRAGIYGEHYALENSMLVEPHPAHPVWRDPSRGLRLLDGMIQAADATWACATERIVGEIIPNKNVPSWDYPWMAWAAAGSEVPARYVQDGGPPTEVRGHLGGELRIWA